MVQRRLLSRKPQPHPSKDPVVIIIDDDIDDDDDDEEEDDAQDETTIREMLPKNPDNKYSTDTVDGSSVASSCFTNNVASILSTNSTTPSKDDTAPQSKNSNYNNKSDSTEVSDNQKLFIGVKVPMNLPVLETRICEGDEVYVIQLGGIKATIPRRKVGSWVNITRFKIVLSATHFRSFEKDVDNCENKKYLKFPQWNSIYTGCWVPLDTARTLSIKYHIYNQLSPLLTFDHVAVTSYSGCKFYEYFVNLNPFTSIRILRKCENDWVNLVQLCDLYEAVHPDESRFKINYLDAYQNSGKQFIRYNDQTLCGGFWIPIEEAYRFSIKFGLYTKLVYILTYNRGITVPYLKDSKLNKRLKNNWKYVSKKYQEETKNLLFGIPNDFKLDPSINKPNYKTLQRISHDYLNIKKKIQKLFEKYNGYTKNYSNNLDHPLHKGKIKNILSRILRSLSIIINLKESYLCHLGETVKLTFPDLDKGVSLDHYLFRRYVDGNVNITSLLRALVSLRFYSHSSADSDPEMQRENELFYMDSLNNLKTCSFVYVPGSIQNDFINSCLHSPILERHASSKLYDSLIDRYESLTYNWDHCINGRWVSVTTARDIVHDSYQTNFKGRHLDRINSLIYSKKFDEKKLHIKYHQEDFVVNDDPFKNDSDSDFECLEMRVRKEPKKRKLNGIFLNESPIKTIRTTRNSKKVVEKLVLQNAPIDRSYDEEIFEDPDAFELIEFKKKLDYKSILGYDPFTSAPESDGEISDFELLDEPEMKCIKGPSTDINSKKNEVSQGAYVLPFKDGFQGLKPGVEVVELNSEDEDDKSIKDLYAHISIKHETDDHIDLSNIGIDGQNNADSEEDKYKDSEKDKDQDINYDSTRIKDYYDVPLCSTPTKSKCVAPQIKIGGEIDDDEHNSNLVIPVEAISDDPLPKKCVADEHTSIDDSSYDPAFGVGPAKVSLCKDMDSGNIRCDQSLTDNESSVNKKSNTAEIFSVPQELINVSSDSSDSDNSDIFFLNTKSTNNCDVFSGQEQTVEVTHSQKYSSSVLSTDDNYNSKDSSHANGNISKAKTGSMINNSKYNTIEKKNLIAVQSKNLELNKKVVSPKHIGGHNMMCCFRKNNHNVIENSSRSTNSQSAVLVSCSMFPDRWSLNNEKTIDKKIIYNDNSSSSDDDIIMESAKGTIVRYNNVASDGNSPKTHLTYFYAQGERS